MGTKERDGGEPRRQERKNAFDFSYLEHPTRVGEVRVGTPYLTPSQSGRAAPPSNPIWVPVRETSFGTMGTRLPTRI